MKYILMPTLEHIARVKIVSTLWIEKHAIIMAYLCNHGGFYSLTREWLKINETIMEKIPHLLLPQSLEDKVLSSIKPIGIQILVWMQYHYKTSDICIGLPIELCWTPQGTVDRMRTAQIFIKNEKLDIAIRYEWACVYCLVDDIPKLWRKLPDHCKHSFLNRRPSYRNEWQGLVSFWTRNMAQQEMNIFPFLSYHYNPPFSYQSLFEWCAEKGNKAATEYLSTKLDPVERKKSMFNSAKWTDDPDTLCFLLSEMDEKKQIEVLKDEQSFGHAPLMHFINWPLQSFFIETFTRVWNVLEGTLYYILLKSILQKQFDGFKDWNYQKLFGEVWKKSSVAVKRYVINASDYTIMLKQLLCVKDKENCRLMLKDVTAIEKKKLVHCDSVQKVCQLFLYDNQWDPLEFFVQECLSSSDEMLQFKDELEKRISNVILEDSLRKNKRKWEELFCLSDNSVSKDDKRRKSPSVEEGQSSSSKGFHSLQ